MNGSGGMWNSWNYEAMRANAQWNIFSISKVSSLRQWYRRGQMIRSPHSAANTEKRHRSEDCWCGWAKAMWYEWMIEPVLIYIVCERLSEVCGRAQREDRINWHLLFVGFMIYEWHFFALFSTCRMILLLAGRWSVRHEMSVWNEFSELLDMICNRHQQNCHTTQWPNSIIIMDFVLLSLSLLLLLPLLASESEANSRMQIYSFTCKMNNLSE